MLGDIVAVNMVLHLYVCEQRPGSATPVKLEVPHQLSSQLSNMSSDSENSMSLSLEDADTSTPA